MKKTYLILILVVIIILIGVTIYIINKSNLDEKNLLLINFKTEDLINSIVENENIKKDMNALTMKNITELEMNNMYNIDIDLLVQYSGLVPMINLSADEIIIVEVKDSNDIDSIKLKFKERADEIAKNFENYLQDEYELAKNALIYSKGKYVIFAISDNNNEIKNIFENKFND